MAYLHEDVFKIFFNAVFETASLDFFTEKIAVALKKCMPLSGVRIARMDGPVIRRLAAFTVSRAPLMPEVVVLDSPLFRRMEEEPHFFNSSGSVYTVRSFTGEETCPFAEARKCILGVACSGIYIPVRCTFCGGLSLFVCVDAFGVNCFSEEHVELCRLLQPMISEVVMAILLGQTGEARTETPGSGSFPTLHACIVEHISRAIERTGGKIGGEDGAAHLLGLNPSTLWSKIRKYRMNIRSAGPVFGNIPGLYDSGDRDEG